MTNLNDFAIISSVVLTSNENGNGNKAVGLENNKK